MKLSEISGDHAKDAIEWLSDPKNVYLRYGATDMSNDYFNSDTVSYNNGKIDVDFSSTPHDNVVINILTRTIPFKFGDIKVGKVGAFYSGDIDDQEKWKSLPENIDGIFSSRCPVQFAPVSMNEYYCGATSLHGIHKRVKTIKRNLVISGKLKDSILGVILISGIRKFFSLGTTDELHELNDVIKIVNKYLGQGPRGVAKAQQELIEADLDDYASL